jgi:hypothetical protein
MDMKKKRQTAHKTVNSKLGLEQIRPWHHLKKKNGYEEKKANRAQNSKFHAWAGTDPAVAPS